MSDEVSWEKVAGHVHDDVRPSIRAVFALQDVSTIFRVAPIRDFTDAPPEINEKLIAMAEACEDFVRAWKRRAG